MLHAAGRSPQSPRGPFPEASGPAPASTSGGWPPLKRGLVESPEQWRWSSYRFYLLDEAGPVRVNVGLGGDFVSGSGGVSSPSLLPPAVRFPPFAKNAKDGAPTLLVVPGKVKSLGHPPKGATRLIR